MNKGMIVQEQKLFSALFIFFKICIDIDNRIEYN